MKWISLPLVALSLLLAIVTQAADTVSLAWDPTPSTPIAGYRAYYSTNGIGGVVSFTTVPVGTLTTQITNVAPGVAFFYATAFLASGLESDPSNVVTYTNKHFGPVNLRITGATNNTAAIWVDNTATNMQVQWSDDLFHWRGWANLQSLDPMAPVGDAIFLSGIAPEGAKFWRAISLPPVTIAAASMPAGLRLTPNAAPIPGR